MSCYLLRKRISTQTSKIVYSFVLQNSLHCMRNSKQFVVNGINMHHKIIRDQTHVLCSLTSKMMVQLPLLQLYACERTCPIQSSRKEPKKCQIIDQSILHSEQKTNYAILVVTLLCINIKMMIMYIIISVYNIELTYLYNFSQFLTST